MYHVKVQTLHVTYPWGQHTGILRPLFYCSHAAHPLDSPLPLLWKPCCVAPCWDSGLYGVCENCAVASCHRNVSFVAAWVSAWVAGGADLQLESLQAAVNNPCVCDQGFAWVCFLHSVVWNSWVLGNRWVWVKVSLSPRATFAVGHHRLLCLSGGISYPSKTIVICSEASMNSGVRKPGWLVLILLWVLLSSSPSSLSPLPAPPPLCCTWKAFSAIVSMLQCLRNPVDTRV